MSLPHCKSKHWSPLIILDRFLGGGPGGLGSSYVWKKTDFLGGTLVVSDQNLMTGTFDYVFTCATLGTAWQRMVKPPAQPHWPTEFFFAPQFVLLDRFNVQLCFFDRKEDKSQFFGTVPLVEQMQKVQTSANKTIVLELVQEKMAGVTFILKKVLKRVSICVSMCEIFLPLLLALDLLLQGSLSNHWP